MRRSLTIFALITLLATTLIPGGARALFELPSIKNKLIELALDQISTPGSFEITAEGIEDNDDGAATLTGVSVADGQGAWLTLERLTFDWQPDALLSGELAISKLELIGLTVSRPPAADAEPPELKPQEPWTESLFDWPRAPIALSIDGVRLERVHIAQGILPQAIRFDAQARAFDKGDLQDLEIALTRTDDVTGTIRIAMKRDFAAETLALTLVADEGPGGMVAAAAGLKADKPARLNLTASGPLTDWKLDFDAGIDRVVDASGKATLKNDPLLAVDADFTVRPGPELEAELGTPIATVLGERAELKAQVIQQEDGMIQITSGHLRSPALNLTASGAFATGAGDSDLAVKLTALAPLADLAEGVSFEEFGFDGQVTGPQGALAADGALSLTGLATAPFEARVLMLNGRVGQTSQGAVFDLSGKGEALRIDRIGPQVIGTAGLTLKGGLTGDLLALEIFELASTPLTVAASGDYDLAALGGALTLSVAAPDLAPVAGAYDVDAQGAFQAKADVTIAGDQIDARFDTTLERLSVDTIQAERLGLEGTATVAGQDVSFDLDGAGIGLILDKVPGNLTQQMDLKLTGAMAEEVLQLDALTLSSPLLLAEASGKVATGAGAEAGSLGLDYRLITTELAPIAQAYGAEAGGALEATGRVEGEIATPRIAGKVTLARTSYQGTDYGDVVLDHDVAVAPLPGGTLTLSASDSPYGPGMVATHFRLDGERLSLTETRAEALSATLAGRAEVDLAATLIEGAFDLAIADLGPIGTLAGTPLSGALEGALKLSTQEARQNAAVDVHLTQFAADGVAIGGAQVTALGNDLLGVPQIDIETDATAIAAGPVVLERTRITARGPLAAIDFSTEGAGTLLEDKPLTFALDGRADASGEVTAINLARLALTADQDEIALRSPLRLTIGGGGIGVKGLDLGLPGGGGLTGNAALNSGALSGALDLTALPLDIAERWADVPIRTGTLDAQARFNTGGSDADLSAQIRALGFDKTQDAIQNIDADLTAAWKGRKLDAQAEVRGDFGQPVRASASLPVRRGANGLPQPVQSGQIVGGVTWRGRLGELWAMVPAPGHVLDGELDVDLTLGGTLAEPRIAGRADLNEGEYQNLDVGTILTDLTLRTGLAEDGAMMIKVEGSDGAKGTLQVDARLSSLEGLPAIDLTTQIGHAVLVRRDDVSAQISGDIAMHGPVNDLALKGALVIDKAEVRLVNNLPPSVVDLEGIRIKGAPEAEEGTGGGGTVSLDLTVKAKRDIFVRGRGLDSEWGMDLAVAGNAAEPIVTGTIERVRGQLDLLGKPFELARGKITFDGGAKIDPLIDVSIEREDNDLRGGIVVDGRASRPEIRFESIPALPDSEVMPRLLFGQSRQSLTGAQAIQLGTGIATLMGGGPGVLGRVRGATGLDVLRIDGDSAEDAALTVGRNVGEGIFVGARQGLAGAGTTVTVEIEVFDGVILDTELGQEGNSSAGVSLRKDF